MSNAQFKRAFFFDEEKTKFSHYESWGVGVDKAAFKSPSSNNFATYFTDCQYTGLKDKSKVEIYEGDICTKMISPDEDNLATKELYRGVVVYHVGGFCLNVGEYYYPMSRTSPVINVIGNIHQNPKLL